MKKMKLYLKIIIFYNIRINEFRKYLKFKKLVLLHKHFDNEYYIKQNPDINEKTINPLWHFYEFGGKENRNPNQIFDTQYYLSQYRDIEKTGMNPLLHYILIGKEEGRQINKDQKNIDIIRNGAMFDEEYYLKTYPEVKANKEDAATHFYLKGYKEGKSPCANFNWDFYSE